VTAEQFAYGVRTHLLRRDRVAVQMEVERDFLEDVAVRPHLLDYVTNRVRLSFEKYCAANETHVEVEQTQSPATWWDMLKADLLLAGKPSAIKAWIARRFPVRYVTREQRVRHIRMCPHIPTDSRWDRCFKYLTADGPVV
jgi:hypothetical protein